MPKGHLVFVVAVVVVAWPFGPSLVAVEDGRSYSQAPEVVASENPGTATARLAAEKPVDVGLERGPSPSWIWGPDENRGYFLKTSFNGGSIAAQLKTTCDNQVTIFLNGKQVADCDDWQDPVDADVQRYIKPGRNELIAEVANQGSAAGFLLKLALKQADGGVRYVVSDASWTVATRPRFAKHHPGSRGRPTRPGPVGRRLQPTRDPRLETRGLRGPARVPGRAALHRAARRTRLVGQPYLRHQGTTDCQRRRRPRPRSSDPRATRRHGRDKG